MEMNNKSLMSVVESGSACYIKNWKSEDITAKHTDVEFPVDSEKLKNMDALDSKDYKFMNKEASDMLRLFARGLICDKDTKLILSIKSDPVFYVDEAEKLQKIAETREYFGVKIPEGIAIIISLKNGEIVPGENQVHDAKNVYNAITEDSKKYLIEHLRMTYLNDRELGD